MKSGRLLKTKTENGANISNVLEWLVLFWLDEYNDVL